MGSACLGPLPGLYVACGSPGSQRVCVVRTLLGLEVSVHSKTHSAWLPSSPMIRGPLGAGMGSQWAHTGGGRWSAVQREGPVCAVDFVFSH